MKLISSYASRTFKMGISKAFFNFAPAMKKLVSLAKYETCSLAIYEIVKYMMKNGRDVKHTLIQNIHEKKLT